MTYYIGVGASVVGEAVVGAFDGKAWWEPLKKNQRSP